ncbi:MAG: protease modulator HflC [Rhodospirillaceae bacterium]|nr:protease modulator HflC [Rhodospirillaceae bacterium]
MSSPRAVLLAIIGIIVVLVASGSFFTVHQTQVAIVVQFGNPKDVISEPGLSFKLPFIQDVEYFDARILDLDPAGLDMVLVDQRRINVDSFARYRIVDPLKFFQTVKSEARFRDQFGNILNGAVRDRVGRANLQNLLGNERAMMMRDITDTVRRRAPDFGIEVVEVRIGRTDLTEQVLQSTYNRMRSDRVAEAAQARGLGQESKSRIEADADRERTVIIAEAEKELQTLLGTGEADSRRILNAAQGKDPEFYSFFRAMEAYRGALGAGTTMVLSPDSEFFKYFDRLPANAK